MFNKKLKQKKNELDLIYIIKINYFRKIRII